MPFCTCLSISRDPLCPHHGDVDKVKSLTTMNVVVKNFDRDAFINNVLEMSDDEAGPACSNVGVPITIDMTEDFCEPYCQGYRHALADVRRVYRRIRE